MCKPQALPQHSARHSAASRARPTVGSRLGSHGPFFFSFPIIHGSAFAAMLGACSPVNDAWSTWQPVRDSSSVAEEWLRLHPGHGRNGLWGIVNGGSSRKGVCLLVPQLWMRNSRCLARSTVGSTQCGIFLMRSCAFGASRRRRAAAASSPGERLHLGTQVCAESSLARFLCQMMPSSFPEVARAATQPMGARDVPTGQTARRRAPRSRVSVTPGAVCGVPACP